MDHSVLRIVSRQRGSWKYQDAYGVVKYDIYVTKRGRVVYKSVRDIVRKASWPQLKRAGYAHLPVGSLHMHAVNAP